MTEQASNDRGAANIASVIATLTAQLAKPPLVEEDALKPPKALTLEQEVARLKKEVARTKHERLARNHGKLLGRLLHAVCKQYVDLIGKRSIHLTLTMSTPFSLTVDCTTENPSLLTLLYKRTRNSSNKLSTMSDISSNTSHKMMSITSKR
jgi:hypothetical protein